MIYDVGGKANGVQFHHAAQKGVKFTTHELFIFGNFSLIFLDHG